MGESSCARLHPATSELKTTDHPITDVLPGSLFERSSMPDPFPGWREAGEAVQGLEWRQ